MPANCKTEKAVFEDGSTRSVLKERYDLIPKVAMDALARRLALGAKTHGENNWRCGGVEFRKASINHLMRHLLDYIEHGNANDENTDAIICNAAFLCHFEAKEPFAGCDPITDIQPEPPPPIRRQRAR
jgi:hypothetical protein